MPQAAKKHRVHPVAVRDEFFAVFLAESDQKCQHCRNDQNLSLIHICLIVRDLLYIVFDIVVTFVLAPMPPAEFVKIAIDLILVVVLVHEVRHVTERLQFASRVIQACNHKALKNLVIGSPNRTEANLIEKAAVNEVRAYQAKLVLAYTGKNGIICRSIILDEQLLSELLFVSPLAGFALKRNQGGFVSAAAKGLLYAVFAADLGNDLDGDGFALILLPPEDVYKRQERLSR